MASVQKVPTASFSPYYGCAIMLMAVLTFGGILAWSWHVLVTQDKVIASLTVDDPETLPRNALAEPARQALVQRLKGFADGALSGQSTELDLTLEELNALLYPES